MRAFDWRPFLTEHHISFIEKGANVKRGELNCRCPFCGSADPSFHMGINLESGFYSCWRNRSQHSGKSPVRLIMRLLHISYVRAREIAGLGESYVDPEGFDAMAASLLNRKEEQPATVEHKPQLSFDKYFTDITDRPLTLRWWNYLFGRWFEPMDVIPMCRQYNLQAARHGTYAYRLVLPYYRDGELVTWTARAIGPAMIRYLDCPISQAVLPAKQTLYNYDSTLQGGKVLVVTEGPVDVIKLDYYAQEYDVHAVGLSTNSITEQQVYMLEDAATRFDRTIVMMDNKEDFGDVDSMRMRSLLIGSFDFEKVPFGRGDPAELRAHEVREWASKQ